MATGVYDAVACVSCAELQRSRAASGSSSVRTFETKSIARAVCVRTVRARVGLAPRGDGGGVSISMKEKPKPEHIDPASVPAAYYCLRTVQSLRTGRRMVR